MTQDVTELTPVQIAVLALAHDSYARHPPPSDSTRHADDYVCVWGSWQAAALKLRRMVPPLLADMGVARGTREMEWQNLRGKHRRGKEGRRVHLYRLERRAVPLAARCAWAVAHLPEGRKLATWRDVPADVPGPRSGERCPTCGCSPESPCTVVLTGARGTGSCVPAGVHGFSACSACLFRSAA